MLRKASIPALRRRIDRIDDQLCVSSTDARASRSTSRRRRRGRTPACTRRREKSVLARLVGQTAARSRHGSCARSSARSSRRRASLEQRLTRRLPRTRRRPSRTCAARAAVRRGGRATRSADDRSPRSSTRSRAAAPTSASCRSRTRPRAPVAHTLDLLVDVAAAHLRRGARCPCATACWRGAATSRRVQRVVAHPQALAQCRRWLADAPARRADRAREQQRARRRARRRARPASAAIAGRGRGGARTASPCSPRAIQDEPGNADPLPRARHARRRRSRRATTRRRSCSPCATRSASSRSMLRPFAHARHRPHQDRVAAAARAAVGVRLLPRPAAATATERARAARARGVERRALTR